MKSPKLLIATTNEGKLREIKHFLNDLPFELVTLDQLNQEIPEPAEDGKTLQENATIKAKYYAEKTGFLSLADDTGLFVDELGGWPGIKSARVHKNDENKREILLDELKNVSKEKRNASFQSVLAFHDPNKDLTCTIAGRLDGLIVEKPVFKGDMKWGFNELFFVEELEKTYGQMTVAEKNSISHRGKALNKMKYFLQNQYGAKHLVVALPIIIKDGKMLITLRNDPYRLEVHKKWEFPGGIIDFGETGESTAIKEAKEEAGYDIEVISQLRGMRVKDHQFSTFRYQVYLIPYICRVVGGDGKYSDAEVLDAKWIDLESYRDYEFLPGDNDFLDELMPEIKEVVRTNNL